MAQAILNGTILDDGGLGCEGRFQYGLTPALGSFTGWVGGTLRTGNSFQAVVSGLLGNTIYYFQAECRNALGGGTAGSILSFITTAAAHAVVLALSPDMIAENHTRLRGYLENDGGRGGNVRFEYGASKAYGMVTPWQQGFATGDEFNQMINGLSPGRAYHARAVFWRNPLVYSGDITFTTLSEVGGMVLIDGEIIHALEAVS